MLLHGAHIQNLPSSSHLEISVFSLGEQCAQAFLHIQSFGQFMEQKKEKKKKMSICSLNLRDKARCLATTTKSLQSCPTLCYPTDSSPPGSPIPGILQARTLEWVAISFSNAWKWKVKVKSLSHVWLFATLCIAAYQAPPSMGFSRQEYWSGLPLPSPMMSWHQIKTLLQELGNSFFLKGIFS